MLEAKELSYWDGKRPLIQTISLKFEPGTLHGIVGPNGSGKTTFLKSLAGIWKPTSGEVFWNNENLLKQERRQISKTISLVAPQVYLPFDFSVYDIVAMGRYAHKVLHNSKNEQEAVEDALNTVEAWHLRERPLLQLSHGERQRVFIARAVATDAPIMALDEPTANLDIRHQLGIWTLLRKLASEGKIVIVATHDLIAAKRSCDRIAVIHEGRCITSGTPAEVMNDDLWQLVFKVAPQN
jgi:ABC-type cobalamin/Fe3+-siderophores transport system ATPase subunit